MKNQLPLKISLLSDAAFLKYRYLFFLIITVVYENRHCVLSLTLLNADSYKKNDIISNKGKVLLFPLFIIYNVCISFCLLCSYIRLNKLQLSMIMDTSMIDSFMSSYGSRLTYICYLTRYQSSLFQLKWQFDTKKEKS